MDVSIVFLKLWGYLCFILSIVFILNPDSLKRLFEFTKDEKFLFVIGFISFIVGLTSIIFHNIWEMNYKSVVTLFGWISLAKGISRIGFTTGVSKYIQMMNLKGIRWAMLLVLGIGSYLLYCAYFLNK